MTATVPTILTTKRTRHPAPAAPEPEHAKATGASRNARKKANQEKAAAAAAEADDTPTTDAAADEELELLEESASSNERSRRAAAIATSWLVSSDTLDAEREMAKRFGAKAVRVAQREAAAEQRGQQQQFMIRGHGRGGGGRAPPTPRRVLLVQPQPEWGRPHGLIKMQTLPNERPASSDEILFAFEWSVEYRRLHQAFEVLIASSPDPNMLLELLHQEPCHIGALAQLHEVATKTGQAELAAELLHRLLWAHEASYSPGFVQAWQKGVARLHHWYPPNRPLFSRASQARRGARPSRLRQGCPISRDAPPLSRPHRSNKGLIMARPLCDTRGAAAYCLAAYAQRRGDERRVRKATRLAVVARLGVQGDERGWPSAATRRDARHRARRQWRWQWWLLFIVLLRSHHHALVGWRRRPASQGAPRLSRHASRVLSKRAPRAPPPRQSSPRDGRPPTRERSASSSVRVEAQAATRPSAISRHYLERSAELWNKSAERVKWVQEVATTLNRGA